VTRQELDTQSRQTGRRKAQVAATKAGVETARGQLRAAEAQIRTANGAIATAKGQIRNAQAAVRTAELIQLLDNLTHKRSRGRRPAQVAPDQHNQQPADDGLVGQSHKVIFHLMRATIWLSPRKNDNGPGRGDKRTDGTQLILADGTEYP